LLLFIRDWNTGAKHSEIAQMVLNAVLNQVAFDRILGLGKAKEIIESLAPYTDRHYARSKQLLISSKVLYFE
jgi:U3 small nucleolar RNA-associated protein 13